MIFPEMEQGPVGLDADEQVLWKDAWGIAREAGYTTEQRLLQSCLGALQVLSLTEAARRLPGLLRLEREVLACVSGANESALPRLRTATETLVKLNLVAAKRQTT